jgi:hypothetical protein
MHAVCVDAGLSKQDKAHCIYGYHKHINVKDLWYLTVVCVMFKTDYVESVYHQKQRLFCESIASAQF